MKGCFVARPRRWNRSPPPLEEFGYGPDLRRIRYDVTVCSYIASGVVSKPSRQIPQAGEAAGQVAGAVGLQRHDAVHVPASSGRARLPVPGVRVHGCGPLRSAPVHEHRSGGRRGRLHAVLGGRDARLHAGHVRRVRRQHDGDHSARPAVDTTTSDGRRLRTYPGQSVSHVCTLHSLC